MITLYDLVFDKDLRPSPFCWRAKLAMKHKDLKWRDEPVGFTEKHKIAFADVVYRNEARQHGDPVGAGDEFERADHGVHFQQGGDLDAVGLEVGFEVAAADVVGAGHHDLERRAIGEPHRRERCEAALGAGQQHLAIAHQ